MMHGYRQEKINVGHYWDLKRNLLYPAVHFAYFGFLCSLNHLRKEIYIYLHKFKRSWFVICDWWISICFVCFLLQGLLLCDRPVLGNNRLVKFASQSFMIFLNLVTCKNKAISVSFLLQKIHSPSRFPSLFLSSRSHSQPSWANTLHCDLL